MVGFGGTLDTGCAEDLQMMKKNLIDGKESYVGLEAS